MSALHVEHLTIRRLRCLEAVDLRIPPSDVVVIVGDNGQGKTSLLETIYLVATSRSFRTSRTQELVQHGAASGFVRAIVRDDAGEREQLVSMSSGRRMVKLNGQRPSTIAGYAVRTPVVVFHPGELNLTMGAAEFRRVLLDRLALYLEPASYEERLRHGRAMKARQRLLQMQGPRAKGLEPFERVMAEAGVRVTAARSRACLALLNVLGDLFEQLAPLGTTVSGRYEPGMGESAEGILERLEQAREEDWRRGRARFGPHRDEVSLLLNDRPIRQVASQGQHRLVVLSLKLAETMCIEKAAGVRPVLLLDDVSSELDLERTNTFFSALQGRAGQVFVTTTRPALMTEARDSFGRATILRVDGGRFAQVEPQRA